jgi:hypothetical protein
LKAIAHLAANSLALRLRHFSQPRQNAKRLGKRLSYNWTGRLNDSALAPTWISVCRPSFNSRSSHHNALQSFFNGLVACQATAPRKSGRTSARMISSLFTLWCTKLSQMGIAANLGVPLVYLVAMPQHCCIYPRNARLRWRLTMTSQGVV